MRLYNKYLQSFLVTFLMLICFIEINANDIQDQISNDTINQTLENRKIGYWIILGNMRNLPDYNPTDTIEEGFFNNNRKVGIWKKYYPNGLLKSEITYINGRASGAFTTYHPTGIIEENGNWKGRVYTGNFERYYEDGTLAQKKTFNDKGKTEGVVEYYHTNGQIELSFTTDNGKEAGQATRYWPNGDLKETIVFDEKGEGVSSGEIARINPEIKLDDKNDDAKEIIAQGETNKGADKSATGVKIKDGYHKTYNDNKDILMDGEFKSGKLFDGKHYIYDENGLLEKIEIYNNGKYVGNGVF